MRRVKRHSQTLAEVIHSTISWSQPRVDNPGLEWMGKAALETSEMQALKDWVRGEFSKSGFDDTEEQLLEDGLPKTVVDWIMQ